MKLEEANYTKNITILYMSISMIIREIQTSIFLEKDKKEKIGIPYVRVVHDSYFDCYDSKIYLISKNFIRQMILV